MSFEEIYDSWADDYDLMYREDDGGIKEHEALFKHVVLPFLKPGKVLEVGCGTGQVAAALTQLGFDVLGTDISAKSIAQAKSRFDVLNLQASFKKEDIQDSKYDEDFNLVTAMSSFITHFQSEGEQIKCLEKFKSALKDDGILVLSIYNYGKLMELDPDDATTPISPIKRGDCSGLYFQRRRWSGSPRSLWHQCSYYTLMDDEEAPRTTHMMRLAIKPRRLVELLKGLGFEDIRWYSPSESGYYQDVCVASLKKNGLAKKNPKIDIDTSLEVENFIIWDGSESLIPKITKLCCNLHPSVSLLHVKITDTPRDSEHPDMTIDAINELVEKIQKKSGKFLFFGTSIQRYIDHKTPDWLTLSYFAAQAAMTGKLGVNHKLMLLFEEKNFTHINKLGKTEITRECREMVKVIMRTEEIPDIEIIFI